MKFKIGMIPMISPLYRFPVWEKMNLTEELDFTFYLESENLHNDIKFIPVETLNSTFKWKNINTKYYNKNFYYQKGVIRLAFSEYDALIFSGNPRGITTWLTSILAKIAGKKIYFWTHGAYGKESKIQIILKKLFFSIPDGIFLYGSHSKKILENIGIPSSKLKLIYNSLDYDFHKKQRFIKKNNLVLKEYFKNDLPILLFVGRLTPQKKLCQLYDAISILETRGKQYNLCIIGDGSEKEVLIKKAQQVKSVTYFYGPCYDENILSDLIYEADLCISPGNVGLTVIHCFSYGTPVITHNNYIHQMPEAEAITDGENGGFFEMDDVNGLADKIEDWFGKMEFTSRTNIRQNCYKIVDNKYNPYYQAEIIKTTLLSDLK